MDFKVVFVVVFSLLCGLSVGVSAQSRGDLAAESVNLRIDASAAMLFADLMSHIRAENDDFFSMKFEEIPEAKIIDRVEQNRRDPLLSGMIDSLLGLPVYAELSSKMRTFAPEKSQGRAAYREAFYRLPWKRTRLMGDVDGQYLQVLKNFSPMAKEWVAGLAERLETNWFAERVSANVSEWLPPDLLEGLDDTIRVYVYFDGNRGCFRNGDRIYIDLMQSMLVDSVSDSVCSIRIACTVAHELHHIVYGNWIADWENSGSDYNSDWRAHALRQWRNAVLTEGAARFCDWSNLPECARQMALDKRLGEEIFATWESVFLRLAEGDIAENEYRTMRNSFNQDRALKWFKQYLTGHYTPTEARRLLRKYPAHRPVPHYYVGYRILSEIFETGGKSALFYAMLHPDEVLDLYRDIAEVDEQAPRVSDETVARWAGL